MINRLVIILKRLAVLLPGIGAMYWAGKDIFVILDRRLPASVSLLATYLLCAYVVIPGALRLIRLYVRPKHVPYYSTTPDGFASDPVNIGIIGTRKQLISAMQSAGWHMADDRTLGSILRMFTSIMLKQPYTTAPFSNLYLFGRRQDLGFQLPVDDDPRHRHHVRFWGVVDVADPDYRGHALYWRKRHRSPMPGQVLWLGAASKDVGIGIIRHNAQLTHMIHSDTDAERELIVAGLKKAGRTTRVRNVTLVKPYRLENRVFTGSLHTDGKMKIVTLKT